MKAIQTVSAAIALAAVLESGDFAAAQDDSQDLVSAFHPPVQFDEGFGPNDGAPVGLLARDGSATAQRLS
ncbi:hypothetical protein [Mesorhizobium prunaredense]|uniref:hypothetical protein n=1 Tax=Mesorhizobium prunaredense TaxID=1631249 RepID=UPI00117C6E82|nr:hypothetical protein [Mesorhizobium prunaredense]